MRMVLELTIGSIARIFTFAGVTVRSRTLQGAGLTNPVGRKSRNALEKSPFDAAVCGKAWQKARKSLTSKSGLLKVR